MVILSIIAVMIAFIVCIRKATYQSGTEASFCFHGEMLRGLLFVARLFFIKESI